MKYLLFLFLTVLCAGFIEHHIAEDLPALEVHQFADASEQIAPQQDFPESTQDGVEIDGVPRPPVADDSWVTWFWDNSDNIAGILIAIFGLVGIIVRLTPTERDDAWYNWIDRMIPNRKKGGGRFP